MPFWAFYMLACVALICTGWRGRKWIAPGAILLGLLGVRVTALLPEVYNEIASCTVWLAITALLLWYKKHLQSFLIGISAAVYLPLIVVGYRIEALGLLPIVSDLFLVLAIGVSGVNSFGKRTDSSGDTSGRVSIFAPAEEGLAMRSERDNTATQGEV